MRALCVACIEFIRDESVVVVSIRMHCLFAKKKKKSGMQRSTKTRFITTSNLRKRATHHHDAMLRRVLLLCLTNFLCKDYPRFIHTKGFSRRSAAILFVLLPEEGPARRLHVRHLYFKEHSQRQE